ncbi:phosphopantetheine-binding protein [Streptomyces boninensis]|uniref:phosphopantetheine-binding protein n=1 Tax=Streptomyces boninensis TaxID=2039455 RepID=UPI003B21B8EC
MLNASQADDGKVGQIVQREIDSVLLGADDAEGYSLDDALMKIGLNSLLLAQLLLQLETELGVDPFEGDRSVSDIRTIRELVSVYEDAVRDTSEGA